MVLICQSCGMPMEKPQLQGTKGDGSASEEYCVHCFKDGKFTFEGSLEEYVEHLVAIAQKMGIPKDAAQAHALKVLPGLQRWR